MKNSNAKLQQLQIRVSAEEKKLIQNAAKRAHMGMSEWVLSQILPSDRKRFDGLLAQLRSVKEKSYVVAGLIDLLTQATSSELEQILSEPFKTRLMPYWENYVAALIECAASQAGIRLPKWLFEIEPLDKPVFGSDLKSLRLHLLLHSPPPFRRRNIFIDTAIGGRV